MAGHLLDRHSFAGYSGLFHERTATEHHPIDRDMGTWLDDNRFPGSNLIGGDFDDAPIATGADHFRHKTKKVLIRPPSLTNRESLQYFRGNYKGCNHQSGEELPDGQSRNESDGHREFHRHL